MPRSQVKYACQSCGFESRRWLGKCPECLSWNSFVEEISAVPLSSALRRPTVEGVKPASIAELSFDKEDRIPVGIAEFDRVLGAGVVAGSIVLVGGDPGIGKSTLMLQVAHKIAAFKKVLYVSGEESAKQIKLRAQRLGAISKELYVLPETNIFTIENAISEVLPQLIIIDSIQTMYREDIASSAGSVAQVRECAAYLGRIAKNAGIPLFLIGHVTKDGSLAGPRILEHMVDTVLYFEGDRHREFRILRAVKNRFGSANEVGIFEMQEAGLAEVANASQIFLDENSEPAAGSVITSALEGSRPLLVEVQALLSKSNLAVPRRLSTGLDYNRALLISAVLSRRAGLRLNEFDIHLSVVGGLKILEPAVDLAVAAAIISGYTDLPVDTKTIFVGEVGLGGEVRAVNQIERRLIEAERLGFKCAVIPKSNLKMVQGAGNIQTAGISTLKEAIQFIK